MSPLEKMLKQPATRDTTAHSPGEILRRLALVVCLITLVLAPVLGLLAVANRDEGLIRGAWISTGLFLALFATRRWWRVAPPTAQRVDSAAPVASASPLTVASTPGTRPRVLLLDASLTGPGGNSSRLLDQLAARLAPHATIERVALSGPDAKTFTALEPALRAADAFVFATGTHWDSWSSALQKFLEDATPAEASSLWLGKPAAVLVTEHSVGGKAVLSRLQGVLVTLGCVLPPLSGLVISKAAQLARRHSPDPTASEDFWAAEDLEIIAHNLTAAAHAAHALRTLPAPHNAWRAWPVDRSHYRDTWLDRGSS